MARKQKFKEWYDDYDDEWGDTRSDSKRYDNKKSQIKEARKNKFMKRDNWNDEDKD